ncbi:sodium:calcium antiporter [Alienimonas sp. DA493]|uniref:sodium:calcium antiporter n=1 Tax=Alienimonas sp. DA493 TaxID=3373605 RepID=UPI0037547AB8
MVFLAGAAAIAVVGTRMTGLADRLADRTGLGEAVAGAALLGAATSLPGIVASVTAALDGRAEMALSNAVGGIAAQTAFLAVADLCYRKANLEHAAASAANMVQAALLVVLLTSLLAAIQAPAVTVWGVHPITPALFVAYVFGLRLIAATRDDPAWEPEETPETVPDVDESGSDDASLRRLWAEFLAAAAVVGVAGWVVTRATVTLAAEWGFNQTVAGALFTAVATSLPELITSVAAVRRGALTLAVGGVIGGNCFDTLFAAAADVAYRDGSLYHAATAHSNRETLLLAVSAAMAGVLLLGLLDRQKRGPATIGWESCVVLVLYAGTLGLIGLAM